MPETLTFTASDGWALFGDLFVPEGEPRATVLLAPAMGVARRFYRPFAEHLAESGLATLVPDYRGMGDSVAAPAGRTETSLHEWGEQDLSAAVRALQARWPRLPRLWVGHSVGGQLLGLYEGPPLTAALLVASQSGHWRHWSGAGRPFMASVWYAGVPLLTAAFGKLPMKLLGQGEDVPKGVALEWARWGRHPDYILSHASRNGGQHFATFTGRMRSVAIADDPYAPRPAVEALLRGFSAARGELYAVAPSDIGARSIGHFGFFRSSFRDSLWRDAVAWLSAPA